MSQDRPALVWTGQVGHIRHTAPRTRFRYRIWMLSLDLDRLDETGRISRWFRPNRFAPLSLAERDHGPRDGTGLAGWARGRLAEAKLDAFGHSIRFLVVPRVAGYAFNPIAFYFCQDASGRIGAVLHQVKNTFGDQHTYIVPVGDPADDARPGHLRGEARKRMHVSPFFDIAGGYRFALSLPDFAADRPEFTVNIRYGLSDQPRLTAFMRLEAMPMTGAALRQAFLAMPLLPFKIILAIHWHALLLWLRGARLHPKPAPPVEQASLGVSA